MLQLRGCDYSLQSTDKQSVAYGRPVSPTVKYPIQNDQNDNGIGLRILILAHKLEFCYSIVVPRIVPDNFLLLSLVSLSLQLKGGKG